MATTLKNKHPARLYIDFDLMDWLRSESARRRIPWSGIVRELIAEKIEKQKRKEINNE